MTDILNENDIMAIHEAQQAVNLAVRPVQALASASNPLLAEIGLDLISQIKEIDSKLTRIALLSTSA